jgi:hypothetical protein
MRLYPQLSRPRNATIAKDVAAVLLILVFAWAGTTVHSTVTDLNNISRGVQDAGTSVQTGFADVATAVAGIPIVGGQLKDGLQHAGGATGGNVVAAGVAGEQAVNDTARILGWVTFLLPTLTLLVVILPRRIRQVRRLTDAQRVLAPVVGPERLRLLAMRAAFGMEWADLEPYAPDPIADLEAGRLDGLVAALYADAGLHPPALAPGSG